MASKKALKTLLNHARTLPSTNPLGKIGSGSWSEVIESQLKCKPIDKTNSLHRECTSNVAGMLTETAELKRLMYEFGGETKMTQSERMENVAAYVGLGMPSSK